MALVNVVHVFVFENYLYNVLFSHLRGGTAKVLHFYDMTIGLAFFLHLFIYMTNFKFRMASACRLFLFRQAAMSSKPVNE